MQLMPMRTLDRLFDEFLPDRGWLPAMDIAEDKGGFLIALELPGVDPKDVDVSITGRILTVAGEKKAAGEEQEYHRVERTWGSFTRTVTLPDSVDAGSVQAQSKDGVLTIRIGKREEVKPRKIDIEAS